MSFGTPSQLSAAPTRARHFSVPFRYVTTRRGGVEPAHEQEGTTMEIADCLELTIRTTQGQRTSLPSFGRPDTLEFSLNAAVSADLIAAAMDRAEPRARALVEGDYNAWDPGVQRIRAMWALSEEGQE